MLTYSYLQFLTLSRATGGGGGMLTYSYLQFLTLSRAVAFKLSLPFNCNCTKFYDLLGRAQ